MTDLETQALQSTKRLLDRFAASLGSHPPTISLEEDYCDGESGIVINGGLVIFPGETIPDDSSDDCRRWFVNEAVYHYGSRDEPPSTDYVERGDFPTLIEAVRHTLHIWIDSRLETAVDPFDGQEGGDW